MSDSVESSVDTALVLLLENSIAETIDYLERNCGTRKRKWVEADMDDPSQLSLEGFAQANEFSYQLERQSDFSDCSDDLALCSPLDERLEAEIQELFALTQLGTRTTISPSLILHVKVLQRTVDLKLAELKRIEKQIQVNLKAIDAKGEVPADNFRRETRDYYAFMSSPYLKTGNGSDYLVAPVLDPDVSLPFDLRRKRKTWSCTHHLRLETCIRKAYFNRKVFFLESRFEKALMNVGFSAQELYSMERLREQFDRQLWKIESKLNTWSKKEKRDYSEELLEKLFEKELNVFSELLKSHHKKGPTLKPLVLYSSTNTGISAQIAVADVIRFRQKELKRIYFERFDRGKIDLDQVDWMMVSKEMVKFCGNRDIPWKKYYKIGLDPSLNCSGLEVDEYIKLQRLTNRRKVIDWHAVVTKLGTKRSQMRMFCFYKRHIALKRESWTSPKIAEDLWEEIITQEFTFEKLATKLVPIVGELNVRKLRSNWKTVNPAFRLGRFHASEDALLLVAMELQISKFLEQDFRDIGVHLPWRHPNIWRCRADILFRRSPKRWTLEEDQLLLLIIKDYGKDWKQLEYVFPGKTRKDCAARHRRLVTQLEKLTLEEFHVLYSRRDVKENAVCPQLYAAANTLEDILLTKSLEARSHDELATRHAVVSQIHPLIFGLEPPQRTSVLLKYLKAFDRVVLQNAYKRLVLYLNEVVRKNYEDFIQLQLQTANSSRLAIEGSSLGYPALLGIENSSQLAIEDSPQLAIEDSPQLAIEDSPQLAIEDSPQLAIEDSPQLAIEDSPQLAIEDSPQLAIEDYPQLAIADSPQLAIEDSPQLAIEDSPQLANEGPLELTNNVPPSPKEAPQRFPQLQIKKGQVKLANSVQYENENVLELSRNIGSSLEVKGSERKERGILCDQRKFLLEKSVRVSRSYLTMENSVCKEKGLFCDRKQFIRENPISVASALQLRKVLLVPQNSFHDLNDFEKNIYTYHNIYSAVSIAKRTALRWGVPSALELALMPELRRIIIPPKQLLQIPKTEFPQAPSPDLKQLSGFEEKIPINWRTVEAQRKLESRGLGPASRGIARKTRNKYHREAAAHKRWKNVAKQKAERHIVGPEGCPHIKTPSEGYFDVQHDHDYLNRNYDIQVVGVVNKS